MFKDKILPIGFLASALTLSGMVVATAQTADAPIQAIQPATVAPAEMVVPVDHRGGKRGRDGRGMTLGALVTDADGDGRITADEIDLARAALVAGAASGDGDISLEEYEAIFIELMRDRLVDSFQELDGDASGSITGQEFDDALGRIIDRMDRNEDGVIDADDRRGHDRT